MLAVSLPRGAAMDGLGKASSRFRLRAWTMREGSKTVEQTADKGIFNKIQEKRELNGETELKIVK